MAICTQCSKVSEGAKFCPECGTPLAAASSVERRERRVVSVLFADLVGFTSRSEQLDVEDVEVFLKPYQALLQTAVERTGGVVAKFTGDGVMALFGAAIAHEDDPERAVRSGLDICEKVAELEDARLNVRVGVTTGEVLVSWDARGSVDAVGDIVNTAARLESAAPAGRMLVDGHSHRATERAILYEPAEPVAAKGKTEVVEAWLAVEPRSIVPSQTRVDDLPLIGREAECMILRGALDRARGEPSTQLVTVVGAPGIGKTRLVEDLSDHVEELPDLITWRRGRSLSYGEGVAFWALGEMLKLEAGILESDARGIAEQKLRVAVDNLIDEDDRVWVLRHLGPLVGLGTSGSSEANSSEAFAAWRRFFEALAEADPTVLVFEDIHWADDQLLDFIDLLTDRAGAVPLLIACTARPELLERRPAWGGGKSNSTTISLTALTDADTARLVGELLEQSLLPAEMQQPLLERAGGNPLYAQEYVRMLQDRGLLTKGDQGWGLEGEVDGLPESVQGIIAARLDTLSPDEKLLMQDAAVVGRTAWLGAVCALTPRSRERADDLLYTLERKQLLARVRRPSITGEIEFRFAHALTLEVAYSQIRRPDRVAKHQAAAAWIDRLAEGREDKAELLAHHYATALELQQQIGEEDGELRRGAIAALSEAGRQAAALNSYVRAVGYYDAALAAASSDDPMHSAVMADRVTARFRSGEVDDEELILALEAQVAAERWEAAAQIEILMGTRAHRIHGDTAMAVRHLETAGRFAERFPYTTTTSQIEYQRLRLLVMATVEVDLQPQVQAAMERARAAGDEAGAAMLLLDLGDARFESGDLGGLADVERAAEQLDAMSHRAAAEAYNSLGWNQFNVGRLSDALTSFARGADWARRLAEPSLMANVDGSEAEVAYYAGEWGSAAELADRHIDSPERFHAVTARNIRGRIVLAHGDTATALADAEDNVEFGLTARNHEFLCPGLSLLALAQEASGDLPAAVSTAGEYLTAWHEAGSSTPPALGEVAVLLARAGGSDRVAAAAALLPDDNRWKSPIVELAEGRYAEAASQLHELGAGPLAADADLLAAGRCQAEGRGAEAERHARSARAFADRTGATVYRRRADELLRLTETA